MAEELLPPFNLRILCHWSPEKVVRLYLADKYYHEIVKELNSELNLPTKDGAFQSPQLGYWSGPFHVFSVHLGLMIILRVLRMANVDHLKDMLDFLFESYNSRAAESRRSFALKFEISLGPFASKYDVIFKVHHGFGLDGERCLHSGGLISADMSTDVLSWNVPWESIEYRGNEFRIRCTFT